MYLTQREAATILKVSIGTIEKLRATGQLKTKIVKGSRRILLLEKQVHELVEEKSSK